MLVIKVCDQGNIGFFSENSSDKNKAIAADKNVQLFFAHPAKSSYLVLNGEAEIILDKEKIKALWTFIAKFGSKKVKKNPIFPSLK